MENILEELKWRGAVNQVSDEAGLEELLAKIDRCLLWRRSNW